MKKRNSLKLIHVNAFCLNCFWTCQDYIKGRQAAHNHAKSKGHSVHIEVAHAGVINERRNEKANRI